MKKIMQSQAMKKFLHNKKAMLGLFIVLFLMAVLLIPGLHGLFDISNALTGADIWKIIGLAFLPTAAVQILRVLREGKRKAA